MKIQSSLSTTVPLFACSIIGIVVLASCGRIHRARMPVSDSLLQTTDVYPISKENGHLKFGDYIVTGKSGWDSSNSWRVFGTIGKDTYKMPVTISLQDQNGAVWKGQCAYSYSSTGVDSGRHWNIDLNIKEGLVCEYIDVKTNAQAGVLEIHPTKKENSLAYFYSGSFKSGVNSLVDFEAAGEGTVDRPAGFKILLKGSEAGAIQTAISGSPTLWMPKTASAEERLAIVLTTPILIRFESPRSQFQRDQLTSPRTP